jgi:hypothetical protein
MARLPITGAAIHNRKTTTTAATRRNPTTATVDIQRHSALTIRLRHAGIPRRDPILRRTILHRAVTVPRHVLTAAVVVATMADHAAAVTQAVVVHTAADSAAAVVAADHAAADLVAVVVDHTEALAVGAAVVALRTAAVITDKAIT